MGLDPDGEEPSSEPSGSEPGEPVGLPELPVSEPGKRLPEAGMTAVLDGASVAGGAVVGTERENSSSPSLDLIEEGYKYFEVTLHKFLCC